MIKIRGGEMGKEQQYQESLRSFFRGFSKLQEKFMRETGKEIISVKIDPRGEAKKVFGHTFGNFRMFEVKYNENTKGDASE